MDQVSNRSGVGSDYITDESASVRWSSDEEESSEPQGQCLAAPQAPLPTYKQRLEDFRKLFKELPESERLIVDYPCALQRDILLQGRLYLTENWLCFYSNVFRGTKITLTLKDVITMTREKTARLIPNAIQVCTSTEKFFFTSFSAREKSYQGVFRMWQNTLLDKPLTRSELWQIIKQHYGHLGLSHEDMESLKFSADSSMQTSLTARPGGDDGLWRLERPPSLRLPGMEGGPLETSTPQGEDFPSLLGSQNSPNMEDSRSTPSQRRSPAPSLDRLAPEKVSKHSSLSLDMNANKNTSEPSGSESIEDVEERVGLSEVHGRLYLNKVFHISASKMFELLFTDSSFIRRFMNIRKTTNSEVYTHDVPYHDYFYTQNRYYIIGNSKRKCRLRVYTDVKYKKQPWGLVKSFITKNSWSGIEENFRQLEAELLEEEAEINQAGGDGGKMGGLRRRRRTYSRTMPEHMKPNKQYGQDPEQHRDGNMGPIEMNGPHRWNTTTIIAGMSVILLILTVMNLGLFLKLWAMEDVAHRMYLSTKHRLKEQSEASLTSEYGPKQRLGLREDAELLKTVLQDSINLLEQLRSSLVVLQQNFAMANRTAEPQ
ncbi:hypothetical protein FQN60_013712 [Etheostoma spectabile]|uniref:VASt domain-containing protein n=1 Tax=Etheostoma spectabile TaxID=54343 RepID=A0A5J5CFV4_9PERO|nr:hypothetical protein FQN60_013712 [Etheostoma spectabile]